MDLTQVMWAAGMLDYVALALVAIWGAFCVILIYRQLNRRQFRTADAAKAFLSRFRETLQAGDFLEAERLCASPEYWYRATPLLARLAVERRHMSIAKLREALAARFEQEVLTSLENLLACINTVIKTAPMLGLWGTVIGMIGAFSKIASAEHPNPATLAGDIYVALTSTALGLVVAIPLVMLGNFIQIRMRKLEDMTVEHVQVVLDDLETSTKAKLAAAPVS